MYFVDNGPLVYQFSCNFQVLPSTFKYWHFARYLLFRATVCVALSSWEKVGEGKDRLIEGFVQALAFFKTKTLRFVSSSSFLLYHACRQFPSSSSSPSSSSLVLHHRWNQSLEKKSGAGTLSECSTDIPSTFWLGMFVLYVNRNNNNKLAYKREDLCQFRHFPIHKRYDSSLLLRFFFILLADSFPQPFFKAFTCSKQNYRVKIFKTASFS